MKNSTKTIVASTTAAVIIGGGITLYNINQDNSIDWSQYDLGIPDITIDLGIPDINVDLGISSVDVNLIDNINNNIENDFNNFNNLTIKQDEVNNFVNKIDKNIKYLMDFYQEVEKSFVDTRNIKRDKTLYQEKNSIKDWMEIYKKYKNEKDVKYIPIKKQFKMITEVRIPKTYNEINILIKNLKYYNEQGYNSILIAFTKDDSPTEVLNTIKLIKKNSNMKIWATYTGNESLEETTFMNVQTYTDILTSIAPYIQGYINSWRRTSSHLWVQDEEFMKYTNIVLRNANPNLPIIGELYYGNSYKYQGENNIGFSMNIFKNTSGVMIVNFGYKLIDVNYLLNEVLKKHITKTPIIALVVGQRPYYRTRNKNGLNYKENIKIKHEIEDEFIKNGCVGTITLSDDGFKAETNNLSKTLYSSL